MFNAVLSKLKEGLVKTRNILGTDIKDLLLGRKIDEETLNRLEEILIAADIGVETVNSIIEHLKQSYKDGRLSDSGQVIDYLKSELKSALSQDKVVLNAPASGPTVILVVGVNGTGKTTSIAKLANRFAKDGKKVLLAAGDTFRAAAIEQLTVWSERLGIDIIKQQDGSDPGAVAFDAAEAAIARKIDVLIVDTAGRLHTKTNLMNELGKIKNVLNRKIPGAPHETLLVLDATTGQNGIIQAKVFNEATPLTGIFLAKLDGTAKGGIIVAIKKQLNLPVKFIGIGENIDDIEMFETDKFVSAIFD
ncbi:MAG: signal recognition particle-docking protein FtsY [Candidatus Brocadiia bacterium]